LADEPGEKVVRVYEESSFLETYHYNPLLSQTTHKGDTTYLQFFRLGVSLCAKGSLVITDGSIREVLDLVPAGVEDWRKRHSASD
jgi:hypothetical protein